MPEILPYLITAALYVAMTVAYWRTRQSNADATPSAASGLERAGALACIASHGFLLYQTMLDSGGVRIGVGDAVSSILWLTVLIYWAGSFVYRVEGLQAMIMPVAAAAALLPLLLPAGRMLPNTELLAFRLHLLISMLAYSLFTIASMHVLLMAMLEKHLHHGTLPAALRRLPPLLTMETMLFRILWAGFVMLTLTLISGVVFSEEVFGQAARFNHKTLFGIVSWLVFAALLSGRRFYGWRGRTAVRWTLAGFMLLILAYLGSKFVLEVLLGRV